MKDFRLALVQQTSILGKTGENLAATEAWLRKAAKAGAQLACFPELNVTGHGGHAKMIRFAESIPDGDSCRRLVALASELGIYICAGLAESEGSAVYNTSVLVGPDGYMGKQRKLHLSGDEYFLFRGGTNMPVFELPFAKVGIIICFDNEHPEPARCLAIDGAELLLCPHAARCGDAPKNPAESRAKVKRRMDHWQKMHGSRAMENGCYVALCDAVGSATTGDKELKGVKAVHAGGCLVVDPWGEVYARSRSRDIREELLIVDMKAEKLHARREANCFGLRVRRPELFKAISRPTV